MQQHCCLCGDLVKPDNYESWHEAPNEMWQAYFSSIYASEEHANATVSFSNRGHRTFDSDVIIERFVAGSASLRSIFDGEHEDDPTARSRQIILNRTDFNTPLSLTFSGLPEVWGYAFHCSCWTVLEKSNPEPGIDVDALFRLCRSQKVSDNGLLDWGHDYGGSIEWVSTPGEERRDWVPLLWDMDYDPSDGLEEVKRSLDEVVVRDGRVSEDQALLIQGSRGGLDAFSSLPVEILSLLLALLPSKDVVNLRLASRRIASIGLTDSFWVSRFGHGHEFEHVYEAKPHLAVRRGHNKLNYMAVKDALDNFYTAADCLKLRSRIWRICDGLHQALRQTKDFHCEGTRIHSRFESDVPPRTPDDRTWVTVPGVYPSVWDTADRDTAPWQTVLYERMTPELPVGEKTLFVYTVDLFGRRYIAGLRIVEKHGSCSKLGYIRPDNERYLLPRPGMRPSVSLVVAFDSAGIRGLALSSLEGDITSDWIGDHEGLSKKDIPAILDKTSMSTVLKGGFDGARLVLLAGFSERHSLIPETMIQRSYPWWPDLPFPTYTPLLGSLVKLRVAIVDGWMLPFCFKTFGGTQGELADRLTGLTVETGPDSQIISFAMHTRKKKDKICLGLQGYRNRRGHGSFQGRRPKVLKHHFVINGPGGERITGIDTVHRESDGELRGIRIHTSFGHSIEAPAQFEAAGLNNEEYQLASVRADGQIVVGFWVTMASNSGIWNIGLMAAATAVSARAAKRNIQEYLEYRSHAENPEPMAWR